MASEICLKFVAEFKIVTKNKIFYLKHQKNVRVDAHCIHKFIIKKKNADKKKN